MTPTMSEKTAVHKALIKAGKYGVQTEVVTTALNAMKTNPKLTIQEAMAKGLAKEFQDEF